MIRPLSIAASVLCLLPLQTVASAAEVPAGSPIQALQAAAETPAARTCASLVGLEIPAEEIGLPTKGGTVTGTQAMISEGRSYCRPEITLRPVDPAAPPIKMQMGLPDSWIGRTVMFGGGGYNGRIPNPNAEVPFGPTNAPAPLGRGMVTYGSDSGHTNSPTRLPTLDGSFGLNDEALRNFAGDALKKTHDTAMFVVDNYYGGVQPTQTYFAGGSTGGREGLAVAQRWPDDFDGVIAIYPAYSAVSLNLFFGFEARELSKPDAFPSAQQQRLLFEAVIAACDPLDGATDRIISNDGGCDFDPRTLRCPGGVNLDTCLSDAQITAIERISSPISFGYPLANKETGYPGFPFLSGADMSTPLLGMGTTPPAEPEPQTAGYGPQFWGQFVKFIVTRNRDFDNLSLDPFAPGEWEQRISDLTALQDSFKTDLSAFADSGGKLLMAHGTADELVSHRATVEYYERIQATMGAERTRDFSRLYLVPGANHALIEPEFSASWDSLTALEGWVRDGQAPPDQIVRDGNTPRTRPLCEYLDYPKYVSGNVNDASSFDCVPRTVTPPPPGVARAVDTFCAAVGTDFQPFTDISGNTFEPVIECAAYTGVARGGPAGLSQDRYGPRLTTNRAQMASLISRMIDTADRQDDSDAISELPPYDGTPAFTDVPQDSPHFSAIQRLEQAGIVSGGPAGRAASEYGPELSVTREQMATFVNRAIRFMTGSPVTSDEDYFDDDGGSVHQVNINAIASAGIAVGDGARTFTPNRSVPRDQIAAFVIRALALLNEDGDIRPAEQAP